MSKLLISESESESESIINKPCGYELIWAKTPMYIGKLLFIRAGESLSLQYHQKKEETLFLESGEVELFSGKDQEHLNRIPIFYWLFLSCSTWNNSPFTRS